MDIRSIIQEEINKFVNEKTEKTNSSKFNKQKEKAEKRDGNNISTGDESQLRHEINRDDLLNIAALARKVYPGHTPEGAQSQLRKKLKGEKNDNGSQYHLKQREASAIRRELKTI